MRVARVYGDRPEILSRLSGAALVELASPSMPASIRQDLESAITAGKTITAPDVRRARQAHARWPSGQPAMRVATQGASESSNSANQDQERGEEMRCLLGIPMQVVVPSVS